MTFFVSSEGVNVEALEEQLRELRKAYATGALRVRVGDVDITYKSEAEMRRIISSLENKLENQKAKFLYPKFSQGKSR